MNGYPAAHSVCSGTGRFPLMNIADLSAQMESDLAWRIDEIRFFENQANAINQLARQDQFRRACVLLLYAHFEGYCKFCFALYMDAINGESIRCGQANFALAAAALSQLFTELRNPESKSPLFRRELPDDAPLHRFARDREFLERVEDWDQTSVQLPADVIDSESNLTPKVLRKILFRLGLDHNAFSTFDGDIHLLIKSRNGIAHGQQKGGIARQAYEQRFAAANVIMTGVKRAVLEALQGQQYLRGGAPM